MYQTPVRFRAMRVATACAVAVLLVGLGLAAPVPAVRAAGMQVLVVPPIPATPASPAVPLSRPTQRPTPAMAPAPTLRQFLDPSNVPPPPVVEATQVVPERPAVSQPRPVRVFVAGAVSAIVYPSRLLMTSMQGEFGQGAYKEDTPDLVQPAPVFRVTPSYTADAMRAKLAGTVVLEAVVDSGGLVSEMRVLKSLDAQPSGLDWQALMAAAQWVFKPGTLNGTPVPVIVTLDLDFRLH